MTATRNGARISLLRLCEAGTELGEPPRQRALQAARQHQRSRTPQLRAIEPLDDHLRAARQPGQRVEIARVPDQDAGDQLVEAETAPAIERLPILGEAPA